MSIYPILTFFINYVLKLNLNVIQYFSKNQYNFTIKGLINVINEHGKLTRVSLITVF